MEEMEFGPKLRRQPLRITPVEFRSFALLQIECFALPANLLEFEP